MATALSIMKNLKTTIELNELKDSYIDLINVNLDELLTIIEDWELEINDDVQHEQYEILEQFTKSIKAFINIVKTKSNKIENLELKEIE